MRHHTDWRLPGAVESGNREKLLNRLAVLLWSDRNVLKLDKRSGCNTLRMY